MNKNVLLKVAGFLAVILLASVGSSCSTYYDAYGYPHHAVDPGVAAAGVLAAGALGYALADAHDHRHRRYSHRRGYSRRHYYHGGRGVCWY